MAYEQTKPRLNYGMSTTYWIFMFQYKQGTAECKQGVLQNANEYNLLSLFRESITANELSDMSAN